MIRSGHLLRTHPSPFPENERPGTATIGRPDPRQRLMTEPEVVVPVE